MPGVVGLHGGVFGEVATYLPGRRVRLQVRIAVLWGRPLAQVAADTRTAVAEQVNALTGLVVDTVDVDIDTVLPDRELAVVRPRRVL